MPSPLGVRGPARAFDAAARVIPSLPEKGGGTGRTRDFASERAGLPAPFDAASTVIPRLPENGEGRGRTRDVALACAGLPALSMPSHAPYRGCRRRVGAEVERGTLLWSARACPRLSTPLHPSSRVLRGIVLCLHASRHDESSAALGFGRNERIPPYPRIPPCRAGYVSGQRVLKGREGYSEGRSPGRSGRRFIRPRPERPTRRRLSSRPFRPRGVRERRRTPGRCPSL